MPVMIPRTFWLILPLLLGCDADVAKPPVAVPEAEAGQGPASARPGALTGELPAPPAAAPAPAQLPPAPPGVEDLVGRLRRGAAKERDEAWAALARIGTAAIPAVIAEIRKGEELKPGEVTWQSRAVVLMAEMGAAAIPVLMPLVADPDRQVRLISVLAIAHMGQAGEVAKPALEAASQDPDPKVSLAAVGALKNLEPRGIPEPVRKQMELDAKAAAERGR